MITFLILFISISLYGTHFLSYSYNEIHLKKNTTDAIKGIFIMVVFLNHISEYYNYVGANLNTWYDKVLFLIPKGFGQLMVVMFLFYSGYGVMESIKRKGMTYVDMMPKKRVLGTLINFDIAVCVFAITMVLLGKTLALESFLLSLTGWDSMGNSNWYIFAIVVCYALTYIGQKINPSMGGNYNCIDNSIRFYIIPFKRNMVV